MPCRLPGAANEGNSTAHSILPTIPRPLPGDPAGKRLRKRLTPAERCRGPALCVLHAVSTERSAPSQIRWNPSGGLWPPRGDVLVPKDSTGGHRTLEYSDHLKATGAPLKYNRRSTLHMYLLFRSDLTLVHGHCRGGLLIGMPVLSPPLWMVAEQASILRGFQDETSLPVNDHKPITVPCSIFCCTSSSS